jgi:pimeloyl-ACP methyl ester carboxylesterase
MVLCGTSLGGTIALDFALAHPEAVERLVLVDAQGFIDGLGPMSSAPRWLATLGVQVRCPTLTRHLILSQIRTPTYAETLYRPSHVTLQLTIDHAVLRATRWYCRC